MKDPLNLLPLMFFVGVVAPFLFGFGISFWLVGKTRRLSWLIPSIVIWYVVNWLLGFVIPTGINFANMLSAWFVAGVMIAFAYAWRRIAIRAKL
jgi:hypothetical protein